MDAILKVAGTSIIQAFSNKDEQPEVCEEQSCFDFCSNQFDLSNSQAYKEQGNEDLCEQVTIWCSHSSQNTSSLNSLHNLV